jgi:cytochrome c-type biogenesis protein CcmE
MTVSAPADPTLPAPRRPWGVLVLIAVLVVVVAYLALSNVGSALVYYLTPGELLARGDAGIGETVRLGGQVELGSVEVASDADSYELRFVLTDGDVSIPVRTTNAPTASFREGSGAVVEGTLGDDGVFGATQVIVKHDENYVAPSDGAQPSDQYFDPGEE